MSQTENGTISGHGHGYYNGIDVYDKGIESKLTAQEVDGQWQ